MHVAELCRSRRRVAIAQELGDVLHAQRAQPPCGVEGGRRDGSDEVLGGGNELVGQESRCFGGPAGVVQGDLFVGNARFRGEELASVFDFELACTERFTWDLASTINAWCWEPSPTQRGGPAGSYSARKLRGLLAASDDKSFIRRLPRLVVLGDEEQERDPVLTRSSRRFTSRSPSSTPRGAMGSSST